MAEAVTQRVYIAGDIAYVSGTVNGVACTWTLTGDHTWSTPVSKSDTGVYEIALTAIDTAGNELNATTTAYYGLHLKTDWTNNDYYNADDINRVGAAVEYIATQLQEAGYSVTVAPRTSYTTADFFAAADRSYYLSQVQAIKDAFYGTGALPDSLDRMTGEMANQLERLLLEVETYINRMLEGMVSRCGVTKTGGYI